MWITASGRCPCVVNLTLFPGADEFLIRCDLTVDHLMSHVMLHDGFVLLMWGLDDDGQGTITGGALCPLFRDAM
jgi:hypothetical protein